MRKLTFYLCLALIFTIPIEGVIPARGLGSLTRLLGFALISAWFATLMITNRVRRANLAHGAIAAYVLWVGLSSIWSVNPNATANRLETYAQLFLLYCIIWDLFLTKNESDLGLLAYICGTYVAALSTLRNFLTGAVYSSMSQTRYTSFQKIDPNSMGVLMALSIPMAWWLIQESDIGRRRHWLRILLYAYIPVATFSILLTASRTALITTVIAFLFISTSVKRLGWGRGILTVAFLIVAIWGVTRLVPAASFSRLGQLDESVEQGNLTGRVDIWREGIQVIYENPLLGVGSGAFPSVNPTGQAAHNLIISVWTETGLIGLAIYLTIIFLALWNAFHHKSREALFWSTLLLIWFIGSFSLNWEYRKQTWLLFSLVISSAHRIKKTNPASKIIRRNQIVRLSPTPS